MPATLTPDLTFARRPRWTQTVCGRQRYWPSRCGCYRVRESRVPGLATVYYAQIQTAWGWDNLRTASGCPRFRARSTAEQACRRHARREARGVSRLRMC